MNRHQIAISAMTGVLPVAPAIAQEILPFPQLPSASLDGRTLQESAHKRRTEPQRLQEDAPDITIFMTDVAGFSNPEVFSGPVHVPIIAKLASEGITHNAFHTAAMCSPTRAALLTGRNHHHVGHGVIAGETSQFGPRIRENTNPVEPRHNSDYHVTADMADPAIAFMRQQRALRPERPFPVYFTPGGVPGPSKPWIPVLQGVLEWNPVRDTRELCNLSEDWSQAHDLAAEMPDKLRQMQHILTMEATRNKVLPVGGGIYIPIVAPRGQKVSTLTNWTFYPAHSRDRR